MNNYSDKRIFDKQKQVAEWMLQAEQDYPEQPEIPNDRIADLRVTLIDEELSELQDAFVNKDLVGVADAIADLLYVVYGTAVACGIDIEPVFAEVHRSNMSKFIDGHKREDGKWIKGPSYSPANLKPILDKQSCA